MELTDTQYDEMVRLSTGRWDPRKGKSRLIGQVLEKLAIALLIILFITSCVFQAFPLSDWLFLALGLLLIFPVLWYRWKSQQTRKAARAHDYFLCHWCRYLLVDLGDAGVCPECGIAYERELCQALYKSAFAPIQLESNAKKTKERMLWRRAILLRDGMIKPEDSPPTVD